MVPPGLPEIVDQRYRLLRRVGRGGMGLVVEVEHLHTGEHLAMKLLQFATIGDPRAVDRFRREARTSALVRSEHVVRVTDAGVLDQPGGAPYVVMELLEGSDLRSIVAERGAQPASDVVSWLTQAARGVERAHAAGIVHRDLKPSNLFLAAREEGGPIVKVLDFGVAKLLDDPELAERTDSGTMLGTPAYMAPEQARGHRGEISPAADLWAMGMIAFHLLKGRRYWADDSAACVLARVVAEPVIAPSHAGLDLGPAFDAWFLKSCHPRPDSRFASATAQAEALALALEGWAPDACPRALPVGCALDEPTLSIVASSPENPPAPNAAPLAPPENAPSTPWVEQTLASAGSLPSPRRETRRRIPYVVVPGAALVVLLAILVGMSSRQTGAPASSSTADSPRSAALPSGPAAHFPPSAPAADSGVPSASSSLPGSSRNTEAALDSVMTGTASRLPPSVTDGGLPRDAAAGPAPITSPGANRSYSWP